MTSSEVVESLDAGVVDKAGSPGVMLTPVAVEQVLALLAAEGRGDLRLRVSVQPGGCSGLRYSLFFDDRLLDNDVVFRFYGAADGASAPGSSRGVDGRSATGLERVNAGATSSSGETGFDPVGFDVVVDDQSLPRLAGSTIDFGHGLQGRGFSIDNPSAAGSCACGDSFH